MADDANLSNLEDDAAPPPEAPAVETPAEPVIEAAPPAEPTAAEVEAVEVGGQKYVPLAAVLAERKEKQAFKEKAQHVDQMAAWIAQNKPMVDFMAANPDLLRRPTAPAAPAAPADDVEALEAAKLYDFYTPEGKADVAKGRAHLNLVQKEAQKIAQQAVQPWAQANAQQASVANYQKAIGFTAPNGQKVDQNALNALWRALPAEMTADPGVALLITQAAFGSAALGAPRTVPPPAQPPVQTEASGGIPRARATLTDLERRVAKERGLSETKFADLGKGFDRGRTNTLED